MLHYSTGPIQINVFPVDADLTENIHVAALYSCQQTEQQTLIKLSAKFAVMFLDDIRILVPSFFL
jgi:hypothetical protein